MSLKRGEIDQSQKLSNIESDVSDMALRISAMEASIEQIKQQLLINMENEQKIIQLLSRPRSDSQDSSVRMGRSKTPNPVTSPRFLQSGSGTNRLSVRTSIQQRPKTPVAPKITIPTSPHRNKSTPSARGTLPKALIRQPTSPKSPTSQSSRSPISPKQLLARMEKNRTLSPQRLSIRDPR